MYDIYKKTLLAINHDCNSSGESATLRQADWGPVFVYGPMLLPAVWGELIGRVPEMAPWALMGG